MKKENAKKVGNIIIYSGACFLAIWKTLETIKLKDDRRRIAEVRKEIGQFLKEADRQIDSARYPTLYKPDCDDPLWAAQCKLAQAEGCLGVINCLLDETD